MQAFASLLYHLTLATTVDERQRLLSTYLAHERDPERGYAIGLITGDITLPRATPALLRKIIEDNLDTDLFNMSQDFVGDVAETISLVWPGAQRVNRPPPLSDIVALFQETPSKDRQTMLTSLMDRLGPDERWAILKLATSGHKLGLSPRTVKMALSDLKPSSLATIEEAWHALTPPYTGLFSWLEGRAPTPDLSHPTRFRPSMRSRAHRLGTPLSPIRTAAEWLYDGASVQLSSAEGETRLYTQDGDDISSAFPDVLSDLSLNATLDATLLIRAPNGEIAPYSTLEKRLKLKTASKKIQQDAPALIVAHDLISIDQEDLRGAPFRERRQRLEALLNNVPHPRVELSPLISFTNEDTLNTQRTSSSLPHLNGIRLKAWDDQYTPASSSSHWHRDPYVIDAILLYAQRGTGPYAHIYSELTFGVWGNDTDTNEIGRIGKASLETSPENHAALDAFITDNTLERFGPVRSVIATREMGVTLKVSFEGLTPSTRHKVGFTLRNAKVTAIEWTQPTASAHTLAMLHALMPQSAR